MFGARARDSEGVRFLERVAADQLGGDLACDCDHRDRIHHGIDQAGDQIGRTRSRCRAAHADAAGGPRVALGGKCRVLLVADQDVANRMVVEGVVEWQSDAARVAEDAIHVLADQALEENFRPRHQLGLGRHRGAMRWTGRHSHSWLKNMAYKTKGHRLGSFSPPMAFRNLISEARQAGPGTATVIIGRSSGTRPIEKLAPEPGWAGIKPMVLRLIIETRLAERSGKCKRVFA